MFPDLYADDHPLRDALRARGVRGGRRPLGRPGADWAAYDLAVHPRDLGLRRPGGTSSWPGPHRVPRLANPADVVEWNTDKHYLGELAAAGLPVTPTDVRRARASRGRPPAAGEWVVKPTISAASQDTGRYRPAGRGGSGGRPRRAG